MRDAETLEWIGFAPIFDSGSSLGFDKTAAQVASENNVICKPFKSRHIEQLKLVSDLSWIDFDRLKDARGDHKVCAAAGHITPCAVRRDIRSSGRACGR